MKVYADTPGRRARQVATDVLVVAWLWFWIWLATKLYGVVLKLGVPGQKLAGAGRDEQHAVGQLAWIAALLLLAVPVAVVLFGWLPLRLRWIRRASAAATWRTAGAAGRNLLALRALTNQPMRRLSTVDEDPVAAWRQGDPEAVAALADLELRRLGLAGQSRRRTSSTVDGPDP